MEVYYYTVDVEINEIDEGVFDVSGTKSIFVYVVDEFSRVVEVTSLDGDLTDNSEEIIKDYFEDEGIEDYKLVNL